MRRCNDREKIEMGEEEEGRGRFGPGPANRFVRKLSYEEESYLTRPARNIRDFYSFSSFLHSARECDRNLLEMILVATLYYF